MGDKLDSATSGGLDGKSAWTSGDDVFSAASKTLEQMLTDLAQPLPGQHAIEQQSSIVRGITRFISGQTQIKPEAGDRRFSDPQWTDNPFYNAYMQCYLAWAKGMNDMAGFIGLDEVSVKRARYFINNLTDALSPTNTMVGNPGAMRRFIETGGKSALDGLKNFLTDLTENRGMPSQVDKSKYKVGGNLAITPGIVVLRTDVIEVIQYRPRTPEVYAIPVLIATSMINKFYALDLAPGRSFVEYALDHGMQVFIISWRNPTAAHKDWSFDTYVDAILQACGVVREICGVDQLHLLAVCAGGQG
jgi:poly[(R)-3-hydroxyalkanoate] polymerase subunit PhaC